uniref:Epithelial membrane protein 1 n=1 Tax=Eptatretus burgeri TaxID=7764 RepID=A0A8C4QSR0_EPTBU
MLILLIGIFILHIITLIFLFVSTISSTWWNSDDMTTDLWKRCNLHSLTKEWSCQNDMIQGEADWFQSVQALMILAVIFACISLILFIVQLYTLQKGGRFLITGVMHLLACLCVLIAAAVYSGHHPDGSPYDKGTYGHSYILAWLSFVLSFINGVIYVALRKRS